MRYIQQTGKFMKKAEVFFFCYSTCIQLFSHESSSILKALPAPQNFTEKIMCISKHVLILLPDVFGNPGQLSGLTEHFIPHLKMGMEELSLLCFLYFKIPDEFLSSKAGVCV